MAHHVTLLSGEDILRKFGEVEEKPVVDDVLYCCVVAVAISHNRAVLVYSDTLDVGVAQRESRVGAPLFCILFIGHSFGTVFLLGECKMKNVWH